MTANLLIVDDEVQILEMLSRHYRFQDYEVETAEDGTEAIRILERKRIDIVITDIMMPKMNGIALLEHLREEYPMTRCIVITGFVSLENALSCMRNGADNCIFKPLEDLDELDESVRNAERSMINWQKKLRELRGLKPEA